MLILQNEPNFARFWLKNQDLPKKQTQNEPNLPVPMPSIGIPSGQSGQLIRRGRRRVFGLRSLVYVPVFEN
jgi:hypothetical protein